MKHVLINADSEHHTSICMYCKVPMQRRAKRDWIVAPKR